MKSKSKLLYAIAPAFLTSTLIGCGGTKTYTVKFNCDDIKETIPDQKVQDGKLASKPTIKPTAKSEVKIFDDYYLSSSHTAFDFSNTPIKSDITIDVRVKDYTHRVSFDPLGVTAEGFRTIDVIHGSSIPKEELDKHTPKEADEYFYSWLENDEWFKETKPITEDVILYAGIIKNKIEFSFTNGSRNVDFDGTKSVTVESKIDGSSVNANWKIVPGYESVFDKITTNGTSATIKFQDTVTEGCIGKVYALYNNAGNDYIGVLQLSLGSFDKLEEDSLKVGTARKNNTTLDGSVVIPAEYYDGTNWVYIDNIGIEGFANTSITSITLTNNIKTIKPKAFYYCNELTEINIPESVKQIGESAFLFSGLTDAKFVKSDCWTSFNNNILINKQLLDESKLAAKFLKGVYANTTLIRKEDSAPLINVDSITLEKNEMYESYCYLYSNQNVKCISSKESIATIDEDGRVVAHGLGYAEITVANPKGRHYVPVTVNNTVMLEDKKISEAELHGGIGVKEEETANLKYLAIPNTIKYNDSGTYKTIDVTAIADNGFNTCSKLTNAYISKKIKSIGTSAFYGCDDLDTVEFELDNTVCTKIGSSAFENCYDLKFINLPNSITEIGSSAFKNCQLLNQIALPKSLQEITAECFMDCIYLHTVTIPSSVKKIDSKVFFRCDRLSNVYYEGTVDQFESIKKETSWCYDTPLEVVHCSDGDWERR